MTKNSEYCQIFFPCTGSAQQYAHRQETIDTTVLSPHGAKGYELERIQVLYVATVEQKLLRFQANSPIFR